MSPQPKISIKRMKRQSPNNNPSNSDFSLSKHSQRSNLPISKKTTQTHIAPCPNCTPEPYPAPAPILQTQPANITFLYSSPHTNQTNHYNRKTYIPRESKPPQTAHRHPPIAKPKQLD
jgi:hypothetical protein